MPDKTLVEALIAVQSEMGTAFKDSKNPHFKSTYASLESCWEACREALTKNGFALLNQTVTDGTNHATFVETTLLHKGGGEVKTSIPVLNPQATMQGMGSALTYARRYNLMNLLQICPEDDDGNGSRGGAVQNVPRGTFATPSAATHPAKPGLAKPLALTPDTSPPTPGQVQSLFDASAIARWSKADCQKYMADNFKKSHTGALTWRECLKMTEYIKSNPNRATADESDFVDMGPFPFETGENT